MAYTWQDLKAYIGETKTTNDVAIQRAFDTSNALVTGLINRVGLSTHIDWVDSTGPMRYQALMVCGADTYNMRKAPNGIAQFVSGDVNTGLRVQRDLLAGVYPLIKRYKVMGL